MGRRPRLSIEQVEATMLQSMSAYVKGNGALLDLWLPSNEDILYGITDGDRPPRSALYRLWPYREDMINALCKHLLEEDLYNTEGLSQRHQEIAESIPERPRQEQDNKPVILALGAAAVNLTDHTVASQVEIAAAFRAVEQSDIGAALNEAQARYINTLAAGYTLVYTNLGVSDLDKRSMTDYGKAVASTARAISLNPFGLEGTAYMAQYQQFLPIHDYYVGQ